MKRDLFKTEAAYLAAQNMLNRGLTVCKRDSVTDDFYFSDGVAVGYISIGEYGEVNLIKSYIPSKENGQGALFKRTWTHDIKSYFYWALKCLSYNCYEQTHGTHKNYVSFEQFFKRLLFKDNYNVFKGALHLKRFIS